ncbi:hypothetical protein TPHA_0B02940 [Tetrapisispora phaffii CBS 4417]|uniref:Protein kinase domain-containing protein n=1 Tax=Tetrapisispora phaffii (strain ATCC 24235 / CBS 4417 / NBRC 1672 / NRRL Y-8282 / UCD 70-5) TaxID=1071381 RepID=G8BPN5_TETPH|nr:hypothetical protein TPHA_0B02940 [Tetrapisispora phaffii CBS 4417]CCE61966.1 hypothetical protein TPHA_0B02940 [Tetrapisispora phaffii CBS 4417]
MNFSSIFKSISNFQFPYTLEENSIHKTELWTVFHGIRKADSVPITAFKANKNSGTDELITNCLQKAKVMKIPGLCPVFEIYDSDPNNTYIITERVSPFNWDQLTTYQRNLQALQLGIAQLLDTLKILEEFIIGTISPESIYVNEKGQWLIFGLELLVKRSDVNSHIFSNMSKHYYTIQGFTTYSNDYKTVDALNMYHLIKHFLSGKVPKDWNTAMNMLSKGSITCSVFLQKIVNSQTWLNNRLIRLDKDLKEIHIKDAEGKFIIMSTFESLYFESRQTFSNMSPGFIVGAIIPELISIVNWLQTPQSITNKNSKILHFLAILLELTDEHQFYPKEFKELTIQMFKLPDRQIRFLLLIYLPKLLEPLGKNDITNRVFPQYLQGLSDSDVTLRLKTLKTVPVIVPSISERQLNNELLRYLAKTQVDPDVEVRTWTILIMTKVASTLSASGSRASILGTAFTKSLKDPDIKPRLAALYGLEKSIDLLDVSTIAGKILTVIAPAVLDKDPLVRSKAKVLFNKYLEKLESEAASVATDTKDESQDIDFDNYGTNDNELSEQFMTSLRLNSPSLEEVNTLKKSSGAFQNDDWDSNNAINEDIQWGDNDAWGEETAFENNNIPVLNINNLQGKKISIDDSWNNDILEEQEPITHTTKSTAGKVKPKMRTIKTTSSRTLTLDIEDNENINDGWGDEW